MKRLRRYFGAVRQKWTLTPKQADMLATIKFPCC